MHFLISGLPESITVGGRDYPICGDFRRWILITELLGEKRLPAMRKLELMTKLAGLAELPDDRTALAEALLRFASCGESVSGSGGSSGNTAPVFDFTADGDAIFSAFYQVYGIDLTQAPLHWWKFTALLKSLPPDTEFMSRIALRTMDLSRIEDDALRKKLRRARARVRLGDGG